MEIFEPDTPIELRHQILRYQVTQTLTDRERSSFLGLPEGCRIREGAKILCQEKLKLGKYVWIGENAILDAQGGLEIGDYTQIGLCMYIWSHSSHKQALAGKTGLDPEHTYITYKKTTIGSNCFLPGPGCIAAGVTIGNNVIVQPCTMITEDIPDGSVVGTARTIKKLESQVKKYQEQLKQMNEQIQEILARLDKDS